MTRSLAALALSLALGAPTAHAVEDDWMTDSEGRRFRVAFDLGSRNVLGAAWDGGTRRGGFAFDFGILVRERDDEGVQWKLDHAFLSGRWHVDGALDATFYRGLFLRWAKDGSLTIPTVPPSTIRLPFDLGFEVAFGRVRRDRDSLRVGAVQADLLFDFWRCYAIGNYLTLRTGVAYDIAADPALTVTATHIVTPFSRVGLDFMHTFDSGREALELHAAFSHRTYVRGSEQSWSNDAEALAAWEVVLLAVNDEPLSLRFEGTWSWTEEPDIGAPEHDLRGTVGLRIGFMSD